MCLVTVYRWLQLSIKRQAISVGWYYLTPHRYNTHGRIFYSLVIVCDIFLFFFFLFIIPVTESTYVSRLKYLPGVRVSIFSPSSFAGRERGQRVIKWTWMESTRVSRGSTLSVFEKILRRHVGYIIKKKKRTNPCEDKIMQDYASKKNSLPLIIEILFFVDFIDHSYEQTWYLNENDSREWSKKIHQSCYFYTLSLIIPYIRIEDKK